MYSTKQLQGYTAIITILNLQEKNKNKTSCGPKNITFKEQTNDNIEWHQIIGSGGHTFKRGGSIQDRCEAIGCNNVELDVKLFCKFDWALLNPLLLSAFSKNVIVWKIDHMVGVSENKRTRPSGSDK